MKHISNATYYVKEIEAKDARTIVKRYHYSHKVVPNSNLHLGVFTKDDRLVGCLQFGTPINKKSTPLKISTAENMLELNRMVMDDEQPRNSESQAISLCLKYVKNYRKDIDWLLSFSDGKQGNVGYIYQATNWDYIGYLLSDSFYELDDLVMHNVSVCGTSTRKNTQIVTLKQQMKYCLITLIMLVLSLLSNTFMCTRQSTKQRLNTQ